VYFARLILHQQTAATLLPLPKRKDKFMPRLRKSFCSALILLALCFLSTKAAHADALLFDNGPGNFTSSRVAGNSPLARITVSVPTTITQIGVLTDLGTNGNIKFLIFNATTNALLFQSGPQAFADDGLAYKVSTSFAPFLLQPGIVYNIGGISDVSGLWATWNGTHTFTQNNITSSDPNGNVVNFASPTLGAPGGADIVIQLYGPAGPAVPEPATLLLLGSGLAGIAAKVGRRRSLNE
jgi:hypothetical protein